MRFFSLFLARDFNSARRRLLDGREREKTAARSFPTRGNDADRDLKAAFSAEEKQPGRLKRATRKNARPAHDPFQASLFLLCFSLGESLPASLRGGRVREEEREKHRLGLNHSSSRSAGETHLSVNSLRREIPAFISPLSQIRALRISVRALLHPRDSPRYIRQFNRLPGCTKKSLS